MQPSGNQFLDAYRSSSNYGVAPTSTAPTQKAQSKGPGGLKGFLINSLPAIGGTLGAVAGLPLNALDLVTGVGGTAADIGAGAVGAGLGEAAKEKLLGQNLSAKQIAIQGAEGGALSGAGAALGAAGKGAKTLTGSLSKVGLPATTDVAEGAAKVAPEAVSPTNVLQKLGQGAAEQQAQKQAAQKALELTAPFEGVDHNILNPPGGAGGLRGGFDTMLNTFKMDPTPEKMSLVADLGTGQSGQLSSTMRQILGSGSVKNVSTDNALAAAQEAIGKEGIGDPGARKGMASDVLAGIRKTVTGKATSTVAGGVGNATLKPNDAFDTLQAMESKIRSINPATAGDKDSALRAGLVAAKSGLEKDLYGSAGLDDAVATHTMTPEEEADLRTDVADKGGSKELSDYLVNTTNNAKTGQELRTAQAPLVELGRIGDAATNVGKGTGMIKAAKTAASAGKAATGSGFQHYGTALEAGALMAGHAPMALPLAAKAARTGAVSGLLSKLAPRGAQDAATAAAEAERGIGGASELENGATVAPQTATPQVVPGTPQSLIQGAPQDLKTAATLPIRMAGTAANAVTSPIKGGIPLLKQFLPQELGRAGGNLAAAGTVSGQSPQSVSPQQAQQELNSVAPQSNTPQVSDNSQTQSPFNASNIESAIMNDVATNGGKNVSQLISLYNTFGKQAAPTAADQTNISNIQDASSYLDTAEQELSQLGGAQGLKGEEANIPVVGKYLAPQEFAYNKTKIDVATSIAKALTGSKPAATIVKAYMDSLPSVTDTPAVAAQKLQNVRLELANKAADYGVTLNGASQ